MREPSTSLDVRKNVTLVNMHGLISISNVDIMPTVTTWDGGDTLEGWTEIKFTVRMTCNFGGLHTLLGTHKGAVTLVLDD